MRRPKDALRATAWFHQSELVCPRCQQTMETGFVNAGKGPFRWVQHPKQHSSIFGGEFLVKQHYIWGRHVAPGAWCRACNFGVFTSPLLPALGLK